MPRSIYLANLAATRYMSPAGEGGDDGAGAAGGDNGSGAAGDEGGEDSGSSDDDSSDDKAGDEDKSGEDKGKPTDQEARLLKDLMKHKTRAKDLESQMQAIKDQQAQLEKVLGGKTPEEIAALVKAQKEAELASLEKKGQYDRIVQQMREENERLLAEKDNAIKELQEKLKSTSGTIEELTVGRSFTDSDFVKNELNLPLSVARREFGDYFEIVDGKVVGYDKPRGSSDRTPLVDGKGETLSFDEALDRLVQKHPDAKSLKRVKAKVGANSGTDQKPGRKADKPPARGLSRIERALSESK